MDARNTHCTYFLNNTCKKGSSCPFLHDQNLFSKVWEKKLEERGKVPCVFFQKGICTKGEHCAFSHTIQNEEVQVVAVQQPTSGGVLGITGGSYQAPGFNGNSLTGNTFQSQGAFGGQSPTFGSGTPAVFGSAQSLSQSHRLSQSSKTTTTTTRPMQKKSIKTDSTSSEAAEDRKASKKFGRAAAQRAQALGMVPKKSNEENERVVMKGAKRNHQAIEWNLKKTKTIDIKKRERGRLTEGIAGAKAKKVGGKAISFEPPKTREEILREKGKTLNSNAVKEIVRANASVEVQESPRAKASPRKKQKTITKPSNEQAVCPPQQDSTYEDDIADDDFEKALEEFDF